MSIERVVCLNCMDGRTQLPVIHWIKETYNVENVDMVTEAGMDGFLANEGSKIDGVTNKIGISIEKNNAAMIFVVGHYDCKGNPVDDATHKENIQSAVQRIKKDFAEKETIGLWVDQDWKVNRLE